MAYIGNIRDAGMLALGADGEIQLKHDHDKGLIVKHIATADNKEVTLTLESSEAAIIADEVIGKIDFKAGDVLVFNHLLVHGSSNNLTNKDRKSIVLQCQSGSIIKDDKIFEKETNFRRKFVTNNLKDKIDQVQGKNIYTDFNKK